MLALAVPSVAMTEPETFWAELAEFLDGELLRRLGELPLPPPSTGRAARAAHPHLEALL
jgi:hypothetical protein